VEAMLAEVAQLCAELDMPGLAERAEAGRHRADEDPGAAVFRHEGDVWTIGYGGRTFRLRDVKGLGYIASLLASPGRQVHVLDLVGAGSAAFQSGPDPVLDDRARQEYAGRLQELEEELDEARDWGDTERAASLRTELDTLTEELARAVGLGGRDRNFSSPAERARISVTKAIRTAIRLVERQSPELAAHLEASVQTGRFCSYAPPGAAPPAWTL